MMAKATNRVSLNDLIDDVLAIGGQMSNASYNLSQHAGKPLDAKDTAILKELTEQWDAARNALRLGQAARRFPKPRGPRQERT